MEQFIANLAYVAPSKRNDTISKSKFANEIYIDPELNDDDFLTVVSATPEGTVYNAHRGTSVAADLGTDVHLAFNNLGNTDRFRISESKSLKSMKKYGHGRIVEVGHSLGGSLAEEISRRHGTKSVAYNAGTTPLKSYKGMDRDRHKHIRSNHDFISMFDSTASNVDFDHSSTKGAYEYLQKLQILPPVPYDWVKYSPTMMVINAIQSHRLSNITQPQQQQEQEQPAAKRQKVDILPEMGSTMMDGQPVRLKLPSQTAQPVGSSPAVGIHPVTDRLIPNSVIKLPSVLA